MNAVPNGTSYKQGPAAAASAGILYYDTRTRVVVSSFTAQSGTQSGTQSQFRLQLNVAVPATEVTAGDFRTSNSATNDIVSVSPTTGSSQNYTITTTNPTNSRGTYTLTFRANSIIHGTGYLQGPASDRKRLTAVTFDTRTAVSVSSFTAPSGTQTGSNVATFTLTLDRSVPASEFQNTDFIPQTGSQVRLLDSITPTSGNQNTYTTLLLIIQALEMGLILLLFVEIQLRQPQLI